SPSALLALEALYEHDAARRMARIGEGRDTPAARMALIASLAAVSAEARTTPSAARTTPPAASTTPPAASTTPPAASTTPPAAGTTPPAGPPATSPAGDQSSLALSMFKVALEPTASEQVSAEQLQALNKVFAKDSQVRSEDR